MIRLLNPGEGDSHSSACVRSEEDADTGPPQKRALAVVDILPAMNGRNSYGVPAGFAGTPTTALLQRRTTLEA